MKRIIFIFLLFFNISFIVSADDGPAVINLQHKGHDDHWEHPAPAVQPEVYYDDVAQEIIIVGTGNATYYNVVIESVNDWDVSLSAQVNGSYDTIDISSLPADEYCITITTAWNDTFVGYFEIE